MKPTSYNQTQFSAENPLTHGRIELPPQEVSPEELAKERALARKRRRTVVMLGGFLLIIIALGVLLASMIQPRPATEPEVTNEDEVAVEPQDLTLREEIDQLILEVDKSNRASRTLVFPPVEAEIRIELP